MGLGAFVPCNCFKPPVQPPEHFRAHYHLDEIEGSPDLDLPYDDSTKPLYAEFRAWMASVCPHDTKYASEHLSNWGGVRELQDALRQGKAYPTLLRELPDANGGNTSSEAASLMLEEISRFEQTPLRQTRYLLVDSDSGETVWTGIGSYGGVQIIAPNVEMGVDPQGIFVRSHGFMRLFKREFFRSHAFTQALADPERSAQCLPAPVTFTDDASGRQYQGHTAIIGLMIPWPDGKLTNAEGRHRFHCPRHLHWATRTSGGEEYAYILKPLRILCEAAIATGNPIVWC